MKNKSCTWQAIVIGCLIVWWICLNQARINYVIERRVMLELLTVIGFLSAFFYKVVLQGKKDFYTIVGFILIGAFIMRAFFTLIAPYYYTTHDIGTFVNIDNGEYGSGHFGYIEYLYHYHHLLDVDPSTIWGFYNPPGFHILAAVVLGITHEIFGVAQPLCYESMQVLTLFFSSMTVWVFYRIFLEFDFRKKYILLATTFVAFFPFFTIYAATLNNDIQGIFFMVLAIWYTIRWYKNQSMKNIIIIAVAIGFGMFTKLNVVLLCFGIGFIFITVFLKKNQDKKKYIAQFGSFLAICMPLGLYMPIRNFIKFNIPFTYIQEVSKDTFLYMGEPGVISRLGFGIGKQLTYAFTTLDSKVEQNIWIHTVRTALFDEHRWDTSNSLAGGWGLILLWGNIILAIVLNIAFFYMLFKKEKENRKTGMKRELKTCFAIMYATIMLSYIKFCFDQPFVCTMNFRYIAPILLFPILGGLFMAESLDEKPFINNSKCIAVRNFVMMLIGIMIMVSVAFTLNLIMLV